MKSKSAKSGSTESFAQKKSPLSSPFAPPSKQEYIEIPVELEEEELPKVSKETPKSSKGFSKGAAIGICLLVILAAIIGLLIFFFIRNRKNEEDETAAADQKAKQKAANDLALAHNELEAYRKNDTMLKLQLKNYEDQLRALKAENVKLTESTDPNKILHDFRNQEGMPTETDFEVPEPPKPTDQKTEAEKNSKEKRKELMALVNKPRKTVADFQQEEADLKESMQKKKEEDSRAIIDSETNSKIIAVHEDEEVDDEVLIDSFKSSGTVKT